MNFIEKSKFRNTKSKQDARGRRTRSLMNMNALQSGPCRSPSRYHAWGQASRLNCPGTRQGPKAVMDEMDCEVFALFDRDAPTPARATNKGEIAPADPASACVAYTSPPISGCRSSPPKSSNWEIRVATDVSPAPRDAQRIPSDWTIITSGTKESGRLTDVWSRV